MVCSLKWHDICFCLSVFCFLFTFYFYTLSLLLLVHALSDVPTDLFTILVTPGGGHALLFYCRTITIRALAKNLRAYSLSRYLSA